MAPSLLPLVLQLGGSIVRVCTCLVVRNLDIVCIRGCLEVVLDHIPVAVVVAVVVVVVVVHEAAVAVFVAFVVAGDDNFAEFGSGDIAAVVDDIVVVDHEVTLVVMVVDVMVVAVVVVVDEDTEDQCMYEQVYVGSSTLLREGMEGKNTEVDKAVTYKHEMVNDMHPQHTDVEVKDYAINDVVV